MNSNKSETSGTRIFLVRHGQPLQHSGKIFLGQANPPLSEKGKLEAAAAGEKLANHGVRAKCIYSSDLARARETADIIAEKLGGIPVIPDILFREMAMGAWDGELIEDIKVKFPGEYEKRGDDPRNYRTPGGENFYDLKGRVTREFYRILSEDFRDGPGDLVIVAHLGVLVSLSEELLSATSPANETMPGNFTTGSVTVFDAPDWLLPKEDTG